MRRETGHAGEVVSFRMGSRLARAEKKVSTHKPHWRRRKNTPVCARAMIRAAAAFDECTSVGESNEYEE
jgi:hypothetical protein